MSTFDDCDDLPTLDEIFARATPAKKAKTKENEEEKENLKSKADFKDKAVDLLAIRSKLDINTAVFAMDFFNNIYVPGIVKNYKYDSKKQELYSVRLYCGREELLGRKHIHSPDDKEFYTLTTISLKNVLESKNIMIRPFDKTKVVKLVEDERDVMMKLLKGELESKRDTAFFTGIQRRSTINSDNSPGPFTLEEYNFFLEYFPDVLVPKLVREDVELLAILEERFEKTGSGLEHLLRQYSYLVLIPEFTIRRILKIDKNVKTYEEANEKFLSDLKAYDDSTGNFINYLYSRKEMYQYAYRENRCSLQEDD